MKHIKAGLSLLCLGLAGCGGGSSSTTVQPPPPGAQFTLAVSIKGNPGAVSFQWQGQSHRLTASQTLHSSTGQTLTEPTDYALPAGYSCDIIFGKTSERNAHLDFNCAELQQFTLQLEVTGNTAPLSFRWFGQQHLLRQQLTLQQPAGRYEPPTDWAFPDASKCQSTETQESATSYRIQWRCTPSQLTLQLPDQLPYTAYLRYRDKTIPVKAAMALTLDSTEPASTLQLIGSDGPQHCALQAQNPQLWRFTCQEFALVYGKTAAEAAPALQLLQANSQSVRLDSSAIEQPVLLSAEQQLYALQAGGLHQLTLQAGHYGPGPLLLPKAIGMAVAVRPQATPQLLALTAGTLYRLEQGQFVRLRDTPGSTFQAPLYGGLDRVSWMSKAEPGKDLSLWQRVATDQNRFASAKAGRRSAASGAILLPDRLEVSASGSTDIYLWPGWEQQELVLDYLASSKVEIMRIPASQSPTLWQAAAHSALVARLQNGQIEQFRYSAAQGFFWQQVHSSSANWLAGSGALLLGGLQQPDGLVQLTSLLRYPNESLLSALQQASASTAPLEIAAARNGQTDETGLAPQLAQSGWVLLYQAGTVWLSDGKLLYRLASEISRQQYLQWRLLSTGNSLAVARDHRQLLLPVALR